jgi:hypothetical protein
MEVLCTHVFCISSTVRWDIYLCPSSGRIATRAGFSPGSKILSLFGPGRLSLGVRAAETTALSRGGKRRLFW